MTASIFNAAPGDFAETALMPGDPLRAQYIAENYLTEARQVTDVRNMLGFTGFYKGMRISVVAHGVGIPSACMYCTELINDYGVQRIIRVGSCGTISASVQVRDIVIAMGASTDSNVNRTRFNGFDFAALADYDLLQSVVSAATAQEAPFRVANVFSSDLFFPPPGQEMWDVMERLNVPVVEMEVAGIYGVAAEYGAKAVALCTVTDDARTLTGLSVEERQTSLDQMISVALEAALLANAG
ncbi:MAG: purine-nucleoside phosphorylase, partial [Gammaproteobacteria bacterium]|nr:purine-nucleoside phosphorylase [Gammaproteobacteria bacterium]MCY4210298.1 purine-nucleoside phosphorylase [Gammaproteobacteria bacterium]MCY4282038.1 purine-nucleoside phosphorylase [Gammaproteobacteria bacterium]MCY4339610.1 purine-nucleoside phosphorylase [Gammaproteobacteria bacterium]